MSDLYVSSLSLVHIRSRPIAVAQESQDKVAGTRGTPGSGIDGVGRHCLGVGPCGLAGMLGCEGPDGDW